MNPQTLFERLNKQEYTRLFVEELGWSNPSRTTAYRINVQNHEYAVQPVAELGGVVVLHVEGDAIPDPSTRLAIHREAVKLHREHLLIFTDATRTQSIWYWVKRESSKLTPRVHLYVRGQPVDLFLAKIQAMQFELAELDEEGKAPVTEVAQRLKRALDVEAVTKRFFKEFQTQHTEFLELIEGIADERDRRWYASVLLNRLMFVWFLQRKGFLDNGDYDYLSNKFGESEKRGANRFYSEFLQALFFEGFAKIEEQRSAQARALLGVIRYLNGGLFLPHRMELRHEHIRIPDCAFANLFKLFGSYSWNLDDRPAGKADEINPDVLGYIFEKYINQKAFGAYYTRPEITRYLCEQTIHRLILDRLRQQAAFPVPEFETLEELLLNLDAPMCTELLFSVLPTLSLLDPACGSGAFLVAAMKTLVNIYGAVLGRISVLKDASLNDWRRRMEGDHRNVSYHIHKAIITDNLYGVDIMEEAAEIARLRLFLALVACARTVDEIEPLPNIDFNILPGNSLIGLLKVDEKEFDSSKGEGDQGDMFRDSYSEIVAKKNRAVDAYRHATGVLNDLRALRDGIETHHREARNVLDQVLAVHFSDLGVRFEQASWDAKKDEGGKPKKRSLRLADITTLKPFHWGYEFDQIMERGGFDAILTNPPWEAFKPNGKEFFEQHSELVTKKKMNILAFEKERGRLLKDPDIRVAWEGYLSGFPHVNAFFRRAPQYKQQISTVNGKTVGSDLNLYKLFTEQCLNLLKANGRLGIVIPSGIYTDLGAKGLRELLFEQTQIAGLFCFENRKEIFEGVHRSFKFVVLTCQKGGSTRSFDAAFMRHNVGELGRFPRSGSLKVSVDLLKRLSPDSLSVMEFKSEADVAIAEKMLRFPLLGEKRADSWNLRLSREMHMTDDHGLFKERPSTKRLPLYEGKMIWQFDSNFEPPHWWIDEGDGRKALLKDGQDQGQQLDYQHYRLVHRAIGRSTDTRTMICCIVPPNVFCVHSLNGAVGLDAITSVFLTAILNSFVFDHALRQKVSANLTQFYIYQTPVPRLIITAPELIPIVERAARLICTTPAFDALWRFVGSLCPAVAREQRERYAVVEEAARACVRAELDALVAHLYDLTDVEFAHILSSFPLVKQDVKDAALQAFQDFAPKTTDQEAAALIASGESASVEFKSTGRWSLKDGRVDKAMEQVIIKTVAALMNAKGGDLFIGVDDTGQPLGLAADYKTLGKRSDRDGYENWLITRLLDAYGKEFAPFFSIGFPIVHGQEICRIHISATAKPVYAEGKLYVRAGNTTRELNSREAVEYVRHRWPS